MWYLTRAEELQFNSSLLSVYFYIPEMPFHKKFITMISKIEEKYPDMFFYAIDVGRFPNQAKRFNINSVPAVLIFKNSKEIKRITGLTLNDAFNSVYADIYS